MPWIFAHGSVMFRPDLEPKSVVWGRVIGWERRFGHPSVRNWGTPSAPAPTCCLIDGAEVAGRLVLVGSEDVEALIAREASQPIEVRAQGPHGPVAALTWPMTADWGELSSEQLAARAEASTDVGGGPSGDAIAYLVGVAASLASGPGLDPATLAYLTACRTRGLLPDS